MELSVVCVLLALQPMSHQRSERATFRYSAILERERIEPGGALQVRALEVEGHVIAHDNFIGWVLE